MIFLTVGTQFPFDRLIKAVDRLVDTINFKEEIFAQIGNSDYKPVNFEAVQSLDKQLFQLYIQKSSAVISHSGMGTIFEALKNEKPLLVMPRLKKYGEVVNNHQVAIAREFEFNGYLLAAYSEQDIERKILELKTFIPRKRRSAGKAVVNRVTRFLDDVAQSYELSNK